MTLIELTKRLNDLESILVNSSDKYITQSRIDMIYWLRNGGNLRTKEEIENKIQRYKEELLAIPNDTDKYYREKKKKNSKGRSKKNGRYESKFRF